MMNQPSKTNGVMSERMLPKLLLYMLMTCLVIDSGGILAKAGALGSWRNITNRTTLENDALQARFQAGLLYELKDRVTGKTLISIDPEKLPAEMAIFGKSGFNLDECTISQKVTADSFVSVYVGAKKIRWELHWSIETGQGDLILESSGRTTEPVNQISVSFSGCDIMDHKLITVSNYGAGLEFVGPWTTHARDLKTELDPPGRSVQPLVALFQGDGSGWLIEGRDLKIGPSNLSLYGQGQTVELLMTRGFYPETKTPEMFEIRIRTYRKYWQDAVDKYMDWLEKDVGFIPIDKKSQKWVKDIRTQAYVNVGDFDGLEALAKRLDPAKTILGRMGGYRPYSWDQNFPNYKPSEHAASWFKRARELGFHVGAHINKGGLDPVYKDLVERFQRGFQEIWTDAEGNEKWNGPGPPHGGRIVVETKNGKRTYSGVPPTVIYSSNANKDWRGYLIEQMRDLVEAGVDMIYLDESMCTTGNFFMDGITGIQGIMALEKEILETYPHVVIETEGINPMCARWSSFALTQHKLGNPLSGYIYSRFAKILPESEMYQPINVKHMDEFQSFGFILPGASTEESWLQIAEAFQKFDLAADVRLELKSYQLFGYRGAGGITAFYEKHKNKRGLVVYTTGKDPQWYGMRVTGIKSWSGPGALRDWAVYDGDTLLALDPGQTYIFDKAVTLSPDKFHITSVPQNFSLYRDGSRRIRRQDIGKNGSFYKVNFIGNGQIKMFVPDDVLVFLDGKEVSVDRQNNLATVQIAATSEKPSVLLAYPKSETELVGKWSTLPWQTPPKEHTGYVVAQGEGFFNHVAGTAQIIGRFPDAKSIRLQGSWTMSGRPMSVGDAVVRLNGREIMRVPPGPEPYNKLQSFDVDISAFAGRYVLLEFAVDGKSHGPSPANWYAPQIVVER